MRDLIAYCITLFFAGFLLAADRPTSPNEAKATDDVLKAVERFKGYGVIQSAQFNRLGRQIYAVWYCPTSGVAGCYLHAYYFDHTKAVWIRFIDRYVHGTHDLSAEMPTGKEVIVFRGTDGKIAVEESVAKFPYKKHNDMK